MRSAATILFARGLSGPVVPANTPAVSRDKAIGGSPAQNLFAPRDAMLQARPATSGSIALVDRGAQHIPRRPRVDA